MRCSHLMTGNKSAEKISLWTSNNNQVPLTAISALGLGVTSKLSEFTDQYAAIALAHNAGIND